MKILHLASFSGNIGDGANHNGLRAKLNRLFPTILEYRNLEIRRFYQNYDGKDKLSFNDDFIEYANKFDLLIIGGGNFFEIWLESSSTGCTIDLPPSILERIQTKILFFGLGFDTYKGYSEKNKYKFLRFIEHVSSYHNKFFLTVRNDGSLKQLTNFYGDEIADKVMKVPDGGFFLKLDDKIHFPSSISERYIALSLASDMKSIRFRTNQYHELYDNLVHELSKWIIRIVKSDRDIKFYLVPHIKTDYEIIYKLLNVLPEFICRNNILVGPYLTGFGHEVEIFNIYYNSLFTISMRFHANVCPIGLGIPTIGLTSYQKIYDLYEELNLLHRVFDVIDNDLCGKLFDLTEKILNDRNVFISENNRIMKKIESDMTFFLQELKNFILI